MTGYCLAGSSYAKALTSGDIAERRHKVSPLLARSPQRPSRTSHASSVSAQILLHGRGSEIGLFCTSERDCGFAKFLVIQYFP